MTAIFSKCNLFFNHLIFCKHNKIKNSTKVLSDTTLLYIRRIHDVFLQISQRRISQGEFRDFEIKTFIA